MQFTQCDSKGRIYLKEDIRARYGKRFFVLEVPGEIILLPVPDDPIADLEEVGEPLHRLTIEEIKQRARQRAKEEALGDLR